MLSSDLKIEEMFKNFFNQLTWNFLPRVKIVFYIFARNLYQFFINVNAHDPLGSEILGYTDGYVTCTNVKFKDD